MPQRLIPLDDLAAPFQIDHEPVRGRLVRMGASVDEILTRHDYPPPVANLLGETCALAALVGSSLKFEGRLIVQAQGDGPVSYVVADYDTEGALRGYCRFDAERLAAIDDGSRALGARTLLGAGVFIMTVDQGADTERYQGVTPIEGETLAFCAERYFAQSEQTPTRVRLAVGQADAGAGPKWRADHDRNTETRTPPPMMRAPRPVRSMVSSVIQRDSLAIHSLGGRYPACTPWRWLARARTAAMCPRPNTAPASTTQ